MFDYLYLVLFLLYDVVEVDDVQPAATKQQAAWTSLLESITSTVKKKSNDTVMQLKVKMR